MAEHALLGARGRFGYLRMRVCMGARGSGAFAPCVARVHEPCVGGGGRRGDRTSLGRRQVRLRLLAR